MSVQRNLIKMPHSQSMAFGQKLNFFDFWQNNDTSKRPSQEE